MHDARRIVGANGDLVHVDIAGDVEQAAAFGHGEHHQRIGLVLGAEGDAFERIDGNIDLRPAAGADRLADIEIVAFVLLALADDDAAGDADLVELFLHGQHGRVIGGLFVALAPPGGGGNGSALGDTHQLERQAAMQICGP